MREIRDKVNFDVNQYRHMFRKIIIIYVLCGLCILFLFYKIMTRPEIQYYASGESGRLKLLQAYTESQAYSYIEENKQSINQQQTNSTNNAKQETE